MARMANLTQEQIQRYYEFRLGERIRRKRGDGADCCCPFHDDKNPSLSVNFATGLWYCHAGCGSGNIFQFEQKLNGGTAKEARARVVAAIGFASLRVVKRTYHYPGYRQVIKEYYSCAETCGCELEGKGHRFERKTFWERRTASGTWVAGLVGVKKVPYMSDELLAHKGQDVCAVESLEDVNTLTALGFRTVCLKDPWPTEWFERYFGQEKVTLTILPDKDESGLKQASAFALKAVQSGTFSSVHWAKPPDEWPARFDATKAVRILHWTKADFVRLFDSAIVWSESEHMKHLMEKGEARLAHTRGRPGSSREQLAVDHLELPEGKKAEILSHDNKVVFGIFEPGGRSIEFEDHIETGGQLYVPRRGSLVQQGAIILPPPPDFSRGEDPELFDDLCAFVCRYWVGPANWIRMTVLYVLLTWIIHALDEVAYLRMIGALGSAKSRFCDVVHALCYRAIRAAGNITAGVLPRVLTLYPDATLVVDEADLHGENAQEVRLILRSGSSRRTPIIKCGVLPRGKDWEPVASSAFGPKIIAARRTTKDDALETRCIRESVTKVSSLGEVPISLPPQFGQEAQTLRARLMAFRIINHGCAKDFQEAIQATGKQLVADECDFRTAQLGASLLALADLLDHELARESCLRVLRHYDACVGLERGQGLDGLLARFVENLRGEGVSSLEMGAFQGALKAFAREECEFDEAFIPRKQALSRKLNAYAHALGIRLMERTSGHAERIVAILPGETEAQQ